MKARIVWIASACVVAIAFCFGLAAALPQTPDKEGFKDPSLFTRPSGYWGDWVDDREFDAFDFPISRDNVEHVEGHFAKYEYRFDDSRGGSASPLKVLRNYQNAAKQSGGTVVYESPDHDQTTLKVVKDGKESWASVQTGGQDYVLVIVDRQAMKQDVVADAGALQSGLAETGHAEVPGIYFDTGKSDVKPESRPALDQVAKLLQANPAMCVWVVGHTDNVGSAESNLALSNARAAAVVKVLTQQMGIDPKRLTPHGAGPYAPVASNKTEDGWARNRRVELVEQ
jgi:outer membrane protein OmpA-like peptidoglycan-associated protein